MIPGTLDARHMTDNLGAMRGPLPDPDQLKQVVAFAPLKKIIRGGKKAAPTKCP